MNKRDNQKLFLFTIDADWIPGSEKGFKTLINFADEWNIKATIFVVGRFALENPDLLRYAYDHGHEIGSHGLEHGWNYNENYRYTDYQEQHEWISRTTEIISNIIGVRPVVFRAPYLWTSETLYSVLVDLGYKIDSSIPSRRFDGIWGMVKWWDYYFAPLNPYYVSPTHMGRQGVEKELIEVPPSAYFFPVVMSVIRRMGLWPTIFLARQVVKRASILNFYCHPWEFVEPHLRPFPPEAHSRYSKNTGSYWVSKLSRFIENVQSWGLQSATVSEASKYADNCCYN